MIKDWWSYTAERFAPRATVPLSAVLGAGVLGPRVWEPVVAARAMSTVFVVLLAARIVDDLADRERDRLRHPERGLCSGRISPRAMRAALLVCCLLALGLNPTGPALAVLGGALGLGALFHAVRPRVPFLARTAFVNAPLLALPLYGEALVSGFLSERGLLAGLFLWLSALGHELGHSLGDASEAADGAPRYTDLLDRRAVAGLSAALYAAALACGALLAYGSPPSLLPALLVAWTVLVSALVARLVCDPRPAHGRALYVPGFLFVLVPAGAAFSF